MHQRLTILPVIYKLRLLKQAAPTHPCARGIAYRDVGMQDLLRAKILLGHSSK